MLNLVKLNYTSQHAPPEWFWLEWSGRRPRRSLWEVWRREIKQQPFCSSNCCFFAGSLPTPGQCLCRTHTTNIRGTRAHTDLSVSVGLCLRVLACSCLPIPNSRPSCLPCGLQAPASDAKTSYRDCLASSNDCSKVSFSLHNI